MKPIIEVNNLSKKYHYGERQPYLTLRDTLSGAVNRLHHTLRGKKQPGALEKDEFWALNNISFKVNRGEAVGIIGANGAGKSTLLKVLSRITPPTGGEATLRGRVGSLLEVGTGFQQELTGRENTYLNGAILGMTRKEIDKKFAEIVEFSEMQKFLDTPVKHYSTGMYMRLAFSIAAHLEPEILIVDEVLAVGDTLFQQKCLGKMNQVAKEYGRTILFVSHNMNAIQSLCKKCILLDKGKIVKIGLTDQVIKTYKKVKSLSTEVTNGEYSFPKKPNKRVQIRKIVFLNNLGKKTLDLEEGEPFVINIDYDVNEPTYNCFLSITCIDEQENPVFFSSDADNNPEILARRDVGTYEATFTFPKDSKLFLNQNRYYFRITFGHPGYVLYDEVLDIPINIIESERNPFLVTNVRGERPGIFIINTKWTNKRS